MFAIMITIVLFILGAVLACIALVLAMAIVVNLAIKRGILIDYDEDNGASSVLLM